MGVGGFETTCHLTGRYPHWWVGRRFETSVDWWVAGKTNETTRDIIQKKLFGDVKWVDGRKRVSGTGMIPYQDIGDITWKSHVPDLIDTAKILHRPTGHWSTCGMKTYQQGRGSFEGTEKHGIWLDEEPPNSDGESIYAECLTRTMTTNGMIIITFTPLGGLSKVVVSFMPSGLPQPEELAR
jgi:phage terminase large subunit-like protein